MSATLQKSNTEPVPDEIMATGRKPLPPDPVGRRLAASLVASVVINLLLFALALRLMPLLKPYRPADDPEVQVSLLRRKAPKPRPTTKPAPTPKPTPKPVPTPTLHPTPVATPTPVVAPTPKPRTLRPSPVPTPQRHTTPPPPEGAHHQILTAGPASRTLETHTVLAGGNARLGEGLPQQSAGNAVTAPAGPTTPVRTSATPTPAPVPEPVKPVPTPTTAAPTPAPTPAPPPHPSGPTRDATPASQIQPTIPDDLKRGDYKSFVRVKVEVAADNSANVVLRTSSGNPEIDRRVLDALKQWKWKAALKNGVPVDSIQLFKFEFEVQ